MAITASNANAGSVLLNATAGQSLVYTVTFQGATPGFGITDTARSRRLLTDTSPQSGQAQWTRQWPLAADPFEMESTHVAQFSYIGGATSYNYKVEIRTSTGTTHTLVDLTFASSVATDIERHDLQVTVV